MLTNCTHIWLREIPNKILTALPGGIDDFSFVYIMRIELSFNPGEIFFIIVNLLTFSIQCCWPFQEAICLSWGALWKWRNCCSAWKNTCITTQVSLVVAVFWASPVNLNTVFLSSCSLSNFEIVVLTKICACRACVLYSDNTVQHSTEVADDLSKCCIKEIEKPQIDRSSGIPTTRLPVPQTIQGADVFNNYYKLSLLGCPLIMMLQFKWL